MLKAARSKSRRDFNSPLAPDTRTIEHSLLLRLIHQGGVCAGMNTGCVISGPALRSLILLFLLVRTGISGFPRIPWRQRRERNSGRFTRAPSFHHLPLSARINTDLRRRVTICSRTTNGKFQEFKTMFFLVFCFCKKAVARLLYHHLRNSFQTTQSTVYHFCGI